jgi:methenyltetrahydromethanopterin cyclohydrolase
MNRRVLTESQRAWVTATIQRAVAATIRDAHVLGIELTRGRRGETIVDCGLNVQGSWEAGRLITEISQGGMAAARIGYTQIGTVLFPELCVESWQPELSAYGFQVSVPLSEIDAAIRVSGPILARFEDTRLSAGAASRDQDSSWGTAVVETPQWNHEIVEALAHRSGLPVGALTLFVAPTASIVGSTQLAGRINECVMFTLVDSLGIPATAVRHVLGAAPVAPAGSGGQAAVGADDLLHYAGRAVVTIDPDGIDSLAALAHQLTFASTPLYGRRFAELLEQAGGVFEAIPGLVDLNKIAQVTLIDTLNGTTISAGARDEEKLREWLHAPRWSSEEAH